MGWFDDDSSSEEEAPSRPSLTMAATGAVATNNNKEGEEEVDEEEDPLDAFMKTLDPTAAKSTAPRASRLDVENEEEATKHWEENDPAKDSNNNTLAGSTATALASALDGQTNHDNEVDEDGFIKRSALAKRALEETFHKAGNNSQRQDATATATTNSDDEEGAAAAAKKSKHIDIQLQKINHAQMHYEPFEKVFWSPPPQSTNHNSNNNNNSQAVDHSWRREHDITVHPPLVLASPIYDFMELKDVFDDALMKHIHKNGYHHPTPVQAQTLPVALSGHDALITAPTGSGKTLAYVWPMVVHVCAQHHLGPNETGPIGLILVPTRELAQQVQKHVQSMLQPFGGTSLTIIGGMGKYPLVQHLRQKGGVEIVVATPGRLLDVLASKQQQQQAAASNKTTKKLNGLSLERTTMVVLDEADRMLQMGFSNQVTQIMESIRPDRQTLLLSATMSNRIEKVAQQWLKGSPKPGLGHHRGSNYVRISVGKTGQASLNVQQHIMVVPSKEAKLAWLQQMLPILCPIGKTLVFCATKEGCEELANALLLSLPETSTCVTLHGDKHQSDRNAALRKFAKQSTSVVLVATDVASRGLDVPQVATVINYDPPKNLDVHTHRVGRAGRLSTKSETIQEGTAYTLLRTPYDADIGHVLLGAMERDGREVSDDLRELAKKSRQQRGHSGGSHHQARNRWNKAGLGATTNNGQQSTVTSDQGAGYYGPTSSIDQPEPKKSRFS